jgi:hypothetical protein
MRSLVLILFLCLLASGAASAQDEKPIIMTFPYSRNENLYTIGDGQEPEPLAEADTPELYLSPDGERLAFLDYPASIRAQDALEPGDYPDDLVVVDLNSREITPLLIHERRAENEIYSGDRGNGIRTQRAWDDPTAAFGSRLFAYVAWSPDSQQIAQVQTVVSNGQHPGTVRLVVYDLATQAMTTVAELGSPGTGYAVFWFEVGIVLYSDPAEGADRVTVFAADGKVLHEWELDEHRTLAHENPVRYQGGDYLAFPQWSVLDVTTGEFTPVTGTMALVSAEAPDQSLVLEACDNRDTLQPTWDIYNAQGEKLTNLERISTPALSPDGQQVVYADYTVDRHIKVYDGLVSRFWDMQNVAFPAQEIVWGAMTYTLTTIGMDDCNRTARG